MMSFFTAFPKPSFREWLCLERGHSRRCTTSLEIVLRNIQNEKKVWFAKRGSPFDSFGALTSANVTERRGTIKSNLRNSHFHSYASCLLCSVHNQIIFLPAVPHTKPGISIRSFWKPLLSFKDHQQGQICDQRAIAARRIRAPDYQSRENLDS
jgi:hypothetical protein